MKKGNYENTKKLAKWRMIAGQLLSYDLGFLVAVAILFLLLIYLVKL